YINLVTAVFETVTGRHAIAGTVFGRNLPRIVRLDGFRFDAMPEGELLLVSNDDRPGIVGMVGGLLGAHDVNIAYMALGRDRIGGQASGVINVGSSLSERMASQVRAKPGILWVKTVRL